MSSFAAPQPVNTLPSKGSRKVRQERTDVAAGISLAVAVHGYVNGGSHDADFAAHGVTRADVDRALYLASASGEQVAADERRVGVVLAACRVPGCCVETVEVVTRIADEEPEQRSRRWADAGFFAAVTSRPDPALPPAAAEHVRAGRTDFLLLAVRSA